MKLVEILAREWKNWPVDAWLPISQDAEGALFVSCRFTENGETRNLGIEVELSDDLEDDVTRDQWVKERARIAANQQATQEARAIAQGAGERFDNVDEMIADLTAIACGKRSKEDQELWDKVASDSLQSYLNLCELSGAIEKFAERSANIADAFMSERAKRMKG